MSIESVVQSNPLIPCCLLFFLLSIFPSLRVFSNESALCIRLPKYWNFSFSISPSNEYSGLISFETESRSVMSDSLRPHGLHSPWNSPGQNTGVGSLSLLQGIFPTQGSNPGLLHYRWILYQLSHKGRPRMLEWVAYPFSSRSSQPKNWTSVSCITGGFFTNWAMREAMISFRIDLFDIWAQEN